MASSTQTAPNFYPLNVSASTILSAPIAAGVNTIQVQSVTGLAVNQFIYFGDLDQGTTEKGQILSFTGTSILLSSNTLYAHVAFEDVTQVFGDEIEFMSAPNIDGTIPADTSFNSLAIVPLTANSLTTTYIDPNGNTSTWYKFRYKNSLSLAVSDLGNSIASRGSDYGNYCTVDQIRQEAGLNDVSQITDVMIDLERQSAQAMINGIVAASYELPLPVNSPATTMCGKIAILIAAGMVLTQQYSVLTPDLSRQGQEKLNQGTALLDMIQNRTLVLTDILGNSLLLSNTIVAWPNNTTATTPHNQGGDCGPRVRMSSRF